MLEEKDSPFFYMKVFLFFFWKQHCDNILYIQYRMK